MLRKNYREYLGCKQEIPLPLTPRLVLVPIKMRTALSCQDGATGYVNLCDIKDIVTAPHNDEKTKCRLLLNGDHSLPSLHTLKSTEKRLKYGHQALDRYCSIKYSCACSKPLSLMEHAGAEVHKKLFTITTMFYELLTDHYYPINKPDY